MSVTLKSKKVRKILEQKDVPLTWLARRMGISRSLLDYDLRNGNVKRAAEIAAILGVDPYSLIDLGEGVADGVSEGKKLGEIPALQK